MITITSQNPGKSTYENVQVLVNTLRKLQYGLTPALRSTEFLQDKIVTACQGSPACRYAVSDPPAHLGTLLHKLQSSITTYEKEQSLGATETFFTDRRYYRRSDQRFRGGQSQQSRTPRFGLPRSQSGPNRRQGVCFICRKEECRSWKHPQREQDEFKTKFRARNLCNFDPKTRNLDDKFNRAY